MHLAVCWHEPAPLDPLARHWWSARAVERAQRRTSPEDDHIDIVSCDHATVVQERYLWTTAKHQLLVSHNGAASAYNPSLWIGFYEVIQDK